MVNSSNSIPTAKSTVATDSIERLRTLSNMTEDLYSRIKVKLTSYCTNEPQVTCEKNIDKLRCNYPEYFSDMRNIMDIIEKNLQNINDQLNICEL